jgi:hypothetical protein
VGVNAEMEMAEVVSARKWDGRGGGEEKWEGKEKEGTSYWVGINMTLDWGVSITECPFVMVFL